MKILKNDCAAQQAFQGLPAVHSGFQSLLGAAGPVILILNWAACPFRRLLFGSLFRSLSGSYSVSNVSPGFTLHVYDKHRL